MNANRCGTNAGFHAHRSAGESPCVECLKARAERERANRARRLATGSFKHATHTAWDSGCRCDECRTWHRALHRTYYLKKTASAWAASNGGAA